MSVSGSAYGTGDYDGTYGSQSERGSMASSDGSDDHSNSNNNNSSWFSSTSTALRSFIGWGEDEDGSETESEVSDDDPRERGAVSFPDEDTLRRELLKDPEVKEKERWVRELIVDNVVAVFADRVMTRAKAERAVAAQVKAIKRDPSNKDLYDEQPFLVQVAIDAAIPSVSGIVLDKVIRIAQNKKPERSKLQSSQLEKAGSLKEVMAGVKKTVMGLAKDAERAIAKATGLRIKLGVDWDSFDTAPSWYVAVDFLTKDGGAEGFKCISGLMEQLQRNRPNKPLNCLVSEVVVMYDRTSVVMQEVAAAQHGAGGNGAAVLTLRGAWGDQPSLSTLRGSMHALRHATALASLPEFEKCDAGDHTQAINILKEACHDMPQASLPDTGNVPHITWVLSHGCYARERGRLPGHVEKLQGTRGSGTLIWAWTVLVVDPKSGKEEERGLAVTTKAVLVGGTSAQLAVYGLDTYEGMRLGPITPKATGCFRCGGVKADARAFGAEIRFAQPEKKSLVFRGLPPGGRGPAQGSAADDPTNEKAHVMEILHVLTAALRLVAGEAYQPPSSESDIVINQSSSAGTFNAQRKGLLSKK
jgi:hypothetical protein